MTKRLETIEEFLARGGQIIKVPAHVPKEVDQTSVNSTTVAGPANILTLGEADLFYGEVKKKRIRKNPVAKKPAIDFSALPEAVRLKFLKGDE
jgi:hypothetical protein